jgi:hypothetical protein
MIKIYEAADGIEAQLIQNLFNHAGIRSKINGEYLQGGIGELQPFGFITLFVNQEDQGRANEIVHQWDSKEHIEFDINDNSINLLANNPLPLKTIKFKYFFLIILIYIILSGMVFAPSNCSHCEVSFEYDVIGTFADLINNW